MDLGVPVGTEGASLLSISGRLIRVMDLKVGNASRQLFFRLLLTDFWRIRVVPRSHVPLRAWGLFAFIMPEAQGLTLL